MAKKVLKNRKQFTSTLENGLYEGLQQMSNETKVPISKLLDMAIHPLLMNHYMKMEQDRFMRNNILKDGQ